MLLQITMEIPDDSAIIDPDHISGLSEEGHAAIFAALTPYGDDIDTERIDPV